MSLQLELANEDNKLHVAMFPWLAFGHLLPFLELAKLIAQKGHKVSFISTHRNIDRLPKLPPHLQSLIAFIKLPLPQVDNLPPEAEATVDLPGDRVPYLKKACDGLQQGLTHFLERSKPDWIIYDFATYWLPPIAAKLGISRAFFSIFWAASVCFFAPPTSALVDGCDPRTEPRHFTVLPDWIPFPSKVTYRLHEAKHVAGRYQVNSSGVSDDFRFRSAVSESNDVILIRSCLELEGDFIALLGKLHSRPAIPIGLLPPFTPDDGGNEDWPIIKKWLDKQKKGSVIYIAFGSEANLSQEVLNELAYGIELSRLPFFWALRKGHNISAELKEGFEDSVKDQGVVWRSWAPQLKILAHESVGGFLTHSGWSSVIEGLHFGHSLVMFPCSSDQGLIARVLGDIKVGVEIPRDKEHGSFGRHSVAEALRLVLVDEEGLVYRDNAKQMMVKIFGDKELHNRYVHDFVEYLQRYHRRAKEDY